MTLRKKTFSAIRWTTAAAVIRALLQVAQVTVLARLLLPEDYGLMAMVTVVLSFGALFSDLGVNSAFVQRQDITLEQRSSLFWLNIFVSGAITLLVVALAPALAAYFGDVRLTPLIMLCASTFVLGALGQQVKLAAEKQLEFRPVALLEMFAALGSFLLTVAMALAGFGVYSLVVAGIFGAALNSTLIWAFLSKGWRPMWRFRKAEVAPFLGFGGATVLSNVINQINVTIDVFLGGRLLTAAQLGFYTVPRNLALQVQMMVNPIVTRVGFPLISQVQSNPEQVRSIFLKTMNMTASTNAPIYMGMAFFAPEAVRVLLGTGWDQSGDLLRILALWGGVRSTANPVGSLLLGMGRADIALKWNASLLLAVPPALYVGSQWGPEGLAWGLLAIQSALMLPGWYFLVRPQCHAGLLEFIDAAFKPFLLSAIAVGVAYWAATPFESVYLRLAVGMILSAPLYLVLSYKVNKLWFSAMSELIRR